MQKLLFTFSSHYTFSIFFLALCSGCGAQTKVENTDIVVLPKGFEMDYYARGIKNARSLTLGDDGTVYVGSRTGDHVTALIDKNGDGKAEKSFDIGEKLKGPNGVAFYNGDLYIAETERLSVVRDVSKIKENHGTTETIRNDLPSKSHHGWRYIAFGPDNKLYYALGAPCNVCEKEDGEKRFGTILRMNADGSEEEIFADGVRNSKTKELWFTDNGRDWLGEDLPGCEVNRAYEKGLHFGFPYCHQGDTPDPKYGDERSCQEFEAPAQVLNAHVAPLGLSFSEGDMFPEDYRGGLFVAEHGSWNRKDPIGYRIMYLKLQGNEVVSYEVFAEGWLDQHGKRHGRPVDVLQMPDGSILISDDHADCVYRVTFDPKRFRE